MWLVPSFSYLMTLAITLYGVRYHIKINKFPVYFSIPVCLAVFLPILIVILLPLDYVSHTGTHLVSWFHLPESLILVLWKITYWITFMLTWLVLPFLMEFYRLGKYYPYARVRDAIKRNLKYQAIVLGISICSLVYLILEVGLSVSHLKLMILAISHVYSLVIAIWLMGHGMILIPKNRWTARLNIQNLNHYYLQLPKLVDAFEDTKMELSEFALQVITLEEQHLLNPDNLQYRDWMLHLASQVPYSLKQSLVNLNSNSTSSTIDRNQISESFMTQLTSNFNKTYGKYVAYESEVDRLYGQIFDLEDILQLLMSNPVVFRTGPKFLQKFGIPPNIYTLIVLYLKPFYNGVLCIVIFAFLLVILESEFLHSTRYLLINILKESIGKSENGVWELLFTACSFGYMLFAALNSLTRLKVFNMYHLVPHNLDPVLTCFYATYIARLTLPLSYNFLTLFVKRDLVFEDWFGALIVLDPLFTAINNWVPRLILIPVVLASFNVYERLKNRLGFGLELYDVLFDDDDEQDNDPNRRRDVVIAEAKRMAHREWLKRQLQYQLPFGRVSPGTERISDEDSDLRPFNLSLAADINYQNNRSNFHDNLVETMNRDSTSSPEPLTENTTFWSRVNNSINTARSNLFPSYRDEPSLEEFDYDNDHLVI